MFVTYPIVLPMPTKCPYSVRVGVIDRVINTILLELRDDQKTGLLCRIGKAITDPVRNPSVIVLYGREGHEGKSALTQNITAILSDAVRVSE